MDRLSRPASVTSLGALPLHAAHARIAASSSETHRQAHELCAAQATTPSLVQSPHALAALPTNPGLAVMSSQLTVYPVGNYSFGSKPPKYEKDSSVAQRMERLKEK